MELRNLKTFILVAELHSFSQAAQHLGYSQSTVSFQIKQLEAELDVHLFERIHHDVLLTDEGRKVLQYAHRIDQLRQDLDASLTEGGRVTGRITLTMAASLEPLFFGPLYAEFRRRYPGISLKVMTSDVQGMLRQLNRNTTDLIFALENHIYNTSYVTLDEVRVPVSFIAGSHHPLARRKKLTMADLVRYPFILTEKGMSYRSLMEEQMAARSLEINPVLETGETEHIVRLVSQGLGLSCLPEYAFRDALNRGEIVRLPVEDFHLDVWLQFLRHRDKWLSPALDRVIEYGKKVARLV
ncbi:MAG: LysR substrate-binding domain-containing protein [Succiniclasticum sp.]|jgi:DNA-binding transcriptional LysR family regulator